MVYIPIILKLLRHSLADAITSIPIILWVLFKASILIHLEPPLHLGLSPAFVLTCSWVHTSNGGTSISTSSEWMNAFDQFMLERVNLDIDVCIYGTNVNNFKRYRYVTKCLKDSCSDWMSVFPVNIFSMLFLARFSPYCMLL